MTKPSLSETLQKLASEHESRSETARLRAVYLDVERALKSGVSRQAVLDALVADGFTMSLKMFDKALYRIRREYKKAAPNPVVVQTPPPEEEEHPVSEQRPLTSKPPMTPAAFREIRNAPVDLRRLSQPVKRST